MSSGTDKQAILNHTYWLPVNIYIEMQTSPQLYN